MSEGNSSISEAELVAFVDGRLEAPRRQAIVDMARKDVALSSRIAVLTDGTPTLTEAFTPLLAAMPRSLEQSIRATAHADGSSAPSRRLALAGLAAAACFGTGIVLGRSLITPRDALTDWREAVAQYHTFYGKQTIAPLNPTPADKARELATVSVALGQSLFNLDKATTDLVFKRAQVLEFAGAPLIQIVFETSDGIAIAFCLKKSRLASTPVDTDIYQGMALAAWTRNGFDELVVGRLPKERIAALAAALSVRI